MPFKALISAIQKLKSNHCFENDGTEDSSQFKTRPEIFDKSEIWWEKPLVSWSVIKRWTAGPPSIPAFYAFAGITFLLSLGFLFSYLGTHDLRNIMGSSFLRIDDSYVNGILFFFLTTSILVTAKTVFKALLATIVVGRVSNLRFELNIYSLALRMHDEALYLSSNRWRGALSAAAVGTSQFFFFAIIYALAPRWTYLPDLFLVSVILALMDLNPYRKSELTSFFNAVFNNKAVSHLLPYLKSRSLLAAVGRGEKVADETIYTTYASLAIAWSIAALNFAIVVFNRNFANLLAVAANSDAALPERISASLIFGGLCLAWLYLVADLGRTFIQNLIYPLFGSLLTFHSKTQTKSEAISDANAQINVVAGLPLFHGVRADAVKFLVSKSQLCHYAKGASIIVQGTASEDLFILMEGEVCVRKRHATGGQSEIARLKSVTAFGENTLLDGLKRSADVIAEGAVQCIKIPKSALDDLKANGDFTNDFETLIDRLRLGQYISGSELFRDAPSEAISLFLNEGKISHISANQDVIIEGRLDKDFYLLVRGGVDVLHGSKVVSHLKQGDFFGEIALLLDQPRTATVRTTEASTVLCLSAERFWFVISHHLSLALFLETVSELRMGPSQDESLAQKELKHA